VANLVAQIEEDAEAERKRTGTEPLGPEAIQAQHPHTRPERVKKSPAPRVHAFRGEVRRQLYEAYSWFLGEYRKATEKLKAGYPAPPLPRRLLPPGLAIRLRVRRDEALRRWGESLADHAGRTEVCSFGRCASNFTNTKSPNRALSLPLRPEFQS
jgi:hypothetical protein